MNPLAYWKFDEAFGGIAYDITTSANNLTSITGITKEYKVNGFKGAVSGFHYDGGSTGHVTGAVNNVPLRILGDVSISVLIKKTGALPGTDSHIVACAHSGETEAANFVYSLRCVAATNELGVFHEYSTGANVSTVVTPILDNVEYYITLTRNSALKEYRIYINGILSSVLTYTSAPTGGSTSVLSIGNHASVTAAWRGLISNVSIFNRTISGAEAVSMYHAIKHGALDEIRYDEIITSSGLIGRWKMTGDAVLVEPNTTGIANGIPVGQISNGLGLFDASSSSKHFDGSTGYLNISGHTLASTTNVSISCWIRVAAINTLRNYIYYAEGGVFLYIENGKLVFGIYNGSTYPSVSSVLDVQIGRAYYLVGTYNATNVRLYIDTVLQGQSASTTAIANVTAYPGSFIGRGNGAAGTHSYFNGNVDDLLAINYALTQKDIDLIYKSSAISGDMTTYLGVLLPMRPVFHLPLNGSANEIISNTATTVVGGVTADIGITNRLNRSLLFNGTTGYINFDAATARVSQFSEITVVAWFNTTAAPANTFGNIIFSINGTGVSNLLRFGIGTSGEIFNSTGAITSQVTGTGYNNGVTHMLAITARSSGANTTMYVDNILMSSTGSPFNFSETLYVSIGQEYDGGPVPTDFYSGKLSTLSIFDRSLTAEEVSLLYNTGRLQS
jgi:hypothetical protein